MNFIKRSFIYVLIILLFISVYKDLTVGIDPNINKILPQTHSVTNFNVVQVQVQHGDTVLSIVEEVNNENLYMLDVKQIIEDFKLMNPNTNPYNLQANTYYYFPLYKKKG